VQDRALCVPVLFFQDERIACVMKRHPKKRAGVLLAVLAAVPMGCSYGSRNGARPPAADSRAWSWAAAAPGLNIYVAYQGAPHASGVRSAWVDRRYFSNLAGVNADVIELRRFDCRQVPDRALTASQQVLQRVCEDGSTQ
jgi:hypothetical protein